MAGKKKPDKKAGKSGRPKQPDGRRKIVKESDPLTPEERLFVSEYLQNGRNALKSYMKVYGSISFASAGVLGCKLLKRVNVKAEIDAWTRAAEKRLSIKADNVLKEFANIAFYDPREMQDADGKWLNMRDMPPELRRVLAGVDISKERRWKEGEEEVSEQVLRYKFQSRTEGLRGLAKYLGLETSITPLEALLQVLPREVADLVREQLARGLNKEQK